MDPLIAQFGRNVARARARAGLTQEELQDRSGVEASEIWRIENGKVNVTIRRLSRLAKELNMSPGELLDGTFEESV